MNETHRASTAQQPTGFVAKLLADKHSVPLSIALHLVPGALIVAAYAWIGAPITRALGLPIFGAWAIGLMVVLLPLWFGLFWLGKQQTGRYTMRGGVVRYRDKPFTRGKITAIGIGLLVYMTVVSLSLAPLDAWTYDTLFTWVTFEGSGSSGTSYLDAYSTSTVITTLLIFGAFTGFLLPLIEEYYFRGFLLPRLPQLGRWAPLFNTVLFSIYHFWAIWTVPSKIIFLLPGVFFVWWKHDIRASIWMHPGSALLMTVVGTTLYATGAM
ncbi:CPBP family intramembrane glutamic endopeptidase [Glycomyces terrestris]|uniref:CPBP family intramembrane metalloprotease n=1 Tax=Glycomyces terrestris TaxID=2493553 RepID=A0A426V0Z4_9ACTN|nr:CPBP family intramembrane glutamic endopeptidase [Glycomyces terrestris]RRS00561.1 CPBP family intramembrane metalloprotease [Glycomyces terrestris]